MAAMFWRVDENEYPPNSPYSVVSATQRSPLYFRLTSAIFLMASSNSLLLSSRTWTLVRSRKSAPVCAMAQYACQKTTPHTAAVTIRPISPPCGSWPQFDGSISRSRKKQQTKSRFTASPRSGNGGSVPCGFRCILPANRLSRDAAEPASGRKELLQMNVPFYGHVTAVSQHSN